MIGYTIIIKQILSTSQWCRIIESTHLQLKKKNNYLLGKIIVLLCQKRYFQQ